MTRWRVNVEAHPEFPCIDPADNLPHAQEIAANWQRRWLMECEIHIQSQEELHMEWKDLLRSRPSDKQRFLELWQQWSQDTMICSFVNTRHPAWPLMLSFGKMALPWLFEQLVAKPLASWGMCALIAEIAGEYPMIRREDRGLVNPVINTYIAWGREHGYLGAERKFIPE